MAYCVIADVQGLNSQRPTYSATTSPSSSEVGDFMTQIGHEIDSILLGRGLSVPVTSPASLVGSLKLANAQGAAALAEMAMFPEAGGTPGGSPHGQNLWKMYKDFLDWLKTGELPSAAATDSSGHVGPFSFHSEHEAEETEPENTYDWQKPKVRKNKDF
jgi:hypothetical protein